MDLTARSWSTAAQAAAVAASSYGSLTVSVPTGTTDGDILTLFLVTGRSGGYLSDAEAQGWERIIANSGGTLAIFQKVAASEPASYTFQTDADITGHLAYPHAVEALVVCWVPPTLAYNESYPFVSGYGWSVDPTGITADYAPSPIGYDTVGDNADTSTRRNLDVVAMHAVTSGTTTGAAYSLPTISGISGTYGETMGTETTLPEIDFGGGFKSRWKWYLLTHGLAGYSYDVTYSGGSGNYLMSDEPGFAVQAYLTLDPLAEAPRTSFPAPYEPQSRKVAVRALPHIVTSEQWRRLKEGK